MDGLMALFERYDVFAAFFMTVRLAVGGAVGSLLIGTLIAVCRVSPVAVLQRFGSGYVTVFRNTPLTLVLALCMLGLNNILGIQLDPNIIVNNSFWWAVVGLSFYHAAFVTEAIRSGINTVPAGQAEAARSIGLSFLPTLRYIILPQAFRGAIAPLGNTMIALTKNTTVAATIGVAEAAFSTCSQSSSSWRQASSSSPFRSAWCSPGSPTGWSWHDERAGRSVRRPRPQGPGPASPPDDHRRPGAAGHPRVRHRPDARPA